VDKVKAESARNILEGTRKINYNCYFELRQTFNGLSKLINGLSQTFKREEGIMNPKKIFVVVMASAVITVLCSITATSSQLEPTDLLVGGKAPGDGFGGVATAGDVNQDGRADIIVSAFGADPFGLNDAGKIYIFSGATSELLWVFNGKAPNDWTEAACCGGDINSDGKDDIIVGVCLADIGSMPDAGKVYILSGVNGDTIKTFSGEAAGDYFGFSICGNVDVDGDGYLDFIIGAPLADPGGLHDAGKVYVFSGEDWHVIRTFNGDSAEDYFGRGLSSGDVDDDGYADIVVGAHLADSTGKADCGKVYVYSGKDGHLIWSWYGEATGDVFGAVVSATGDVNGDGYADIVVGSAWADYEGMTDAGKVWVFSGKTDSLLYTFHGQNAGDYFGFSVAIAGDVNLLRDGKDDIIIGAPFAGANETGKAYLFSGADGDTLCVFSGDTYNNRFGYAVSGAGDINRDGKDELLVGEEWADPCGLTDAGKVYVYSGVTCDTLFTLCAPTIIVTSPIGGECWQVGSVHNITWNSCCFTSNVKIGYSTNSGTSWTTIVESTANTGSYPWTIPITPSVKCRVKISMVVDTSTYDISDNDFYIGQTSVPTITVTSPNGGECWQIGSTHNITWNSSCVPENVKIEFSIDNGVNWKTITPNTENDGLYPWPIPNDTSLISVNCLVKICAIDGDPCDVSDNNFFIGETPNPSVRVIKPNGGEVWCTVQVDTIKWVSSCLPQNVKIEYDTNSGNPPWTTITSNTPNTGTYPWQIPNLNSDHCRVRICAVSGSPCDTSDADFTISDHWMLQVTSPNGGEIWCVGSTYEVTWGSYCNLISQDIRIDYSTNGGVSWDTITSRTADDHSYMWTIPNTVTPSSNCRIRVCDYLDCDPYDVSDADFIISVPTVIVTSPAGGETWCVGHTETIRWTSYCLTNGVKIDYSTNSGASWNLIDANPENDGSYDWLVPNTPSTLCKIRVCDVDENPCDTSNIFTIIPGFITVISPNGHEIWNVGDIDTIKWNSSCIIGNVWIDLSTNGGIQWHNITSSTPNDGKYEWKIPCQHSDSCLVRVCGTRDDADTLCDISNSFFTLTCLVPILTEFGLVVLLILLMGTAVWMIRRKRLATERNN
jgi:ABC-type amino acid transport substrate-binding protein